MEFKYKPYKRSAKVLWYGEFLIIGAWLIGATAIILLFAGFVNLIGLAIQTLFFN